MILREQSISLDTTDGASQLLGGVWFYFDVVVSFESRQETSGFNSETALDSVHQNFQ